MKRKISPVYSPKTRKAAFLLSLLLHLVLIALYVFISDNRDNFALDSTPSHSPEPQEKRLTFELVETPENIADQLPSAETELASDQSAKAQDLYSETELDAGLPYNDGFSEAKNYPLTPTLPVTESDLAENSLTEDAQEQETAETAKNDSESLRELLKEKDTALKEQLRNPETAFKNLDTSASDMGGFSFNTYNWDFAPYLITMKRRIRSNMNLPYAFTHLGAISGDILVHFTVLPSGVVSKLEVLKSDAHYSLEQSSVNAIQLSSAFQPLPSDFPEDRLEVTAKFSFSILKD
ncbi:MAG: energy transducer TonB [Candidatus Cloacimonetes bacterium]|nr:energy transducer TonB [Candidatus Cloacimonadota bacterium]